MRKTGNGRLGLAVVLFMAFIVGVVMAGCGPSPEDVYGKTISVETQKITAAFSDIATAFQELRKDETLIEDPAWIGRVKAAAAKVQASHDRLNALTPPDSMKAVHTSLIDATQDCSDAMDSLTTSLDNHDAGELQSALDLITSCAEKIDATSAMMPKK